MAIKVDSVERYGANGILGLVCSGGTRQGRPVSGMLHPWRKCTTRSWSERLRSGRAIVKLFIEREVQYLVFVVAFGSWEGSEKGNRRACLECIPAATPGSCLQ